MAIGLKFALFDEGIVVRTSSIKGQDDLFILRYRNNKDSLPKNWKETDMGNRREWKYIK